MISVLVVQRFRLDQASSVDPLNLLREITQNGISQDVCVNDLGMREHLLICQLFPPLIIVSFIYFFRCFYMMGYWRVCVFVYFSEPPAFEVLPSLKKLKKRIIAAGRGDYNAVFMSGR